MKTLFLTFGLLLGTIASYAQAGKLIVNNTSGSDITVTAGVVNSVSCDDPSSITINIPSGQTRVFIPTQGLNYEWRGVSAVETPSGGFGPPPGTVVSSYPCGSNCGPLADVSNGLTASWNCSNNEVTID